MAVQKINGYDLGQNAGITKNFELSDIKRAIVSHDFDTLSFIVRTSSEGTKLPQTLSEVFGEHPVRIELKVEPRHLYHAADSEDEKLLRVTIFRLDLENEQNPFSVFIPDYIMGQEMRSIARGDTRKGFLAMNCAQELLRLYKLYHKQGE